MSLALVLPHGNTKTVSSSWWPSWGVAFPRNSLTAYSVPGALSAWPWRRKGWEQPEDQDVRVTPGASFFPGPAQLLYRGSGETHNAHLTQLPGMLQPLKAGHSGESSCQPGWPGVPFQLSNLEGREPGILPPTWAMLSQAWRHFHAQSLLTPTGCWSFSVRAFDVRWIHFGEHPSFCMESPEKLPGSGAALPIICCL